MNTQLPLRLQLRDDAAFENFKPGRNTELLSLLQQHAVSEHDWLTCIYGERGSGKSHLLQAACHQAQYWQETILYLPMSQAPDWSPAVLADLEETGLVCLDDIECVAGQGPWETALFNLLEARRTRRSRTIITSTKPLPGIAWALADLATRLNGWGLVFELHALRDEEKIQALQQRAKNRGLELSEDVARYVLNRYPRDMQTLFDLMETLDQESLARQRRITIPFLRTLEGAGLTKTG